MFISLAVSLSLLPGRPYIFLVRSVNRIGPGPWSEPLEVVSGAGPPDTPHPPHLACRSPHSVHLVWEEPINNGAGIEQYSIQIAEVRIDAVVERGKVSLVQAGFVLFMDGSAAVKGSVLDIPLFFPFYLTFIFSLVELDGLLSELSYTCCSPRLPGGLFFSSRFLRYSLKLHLFPY